MPEDLVRLDAEMQAREAAKEAARRPHLRVNIDPDYEFKPGEMEISYTDPNATY